MQEFLTFVILLSALSASDEQTVCWVKLIQASILTWTNLWKQETHKRWLLWRDQSSMWVCGRVWFTACSVCLPLSWPTYGPFPTSNLHTKAMVSSSSSVSLMLTESSIETPFALRTGMEMPYSW